MQHVEGSALEGLPLICKLHATVDCGFSGAFLKEHGAFTEAVPAAALLVSRGLTYLVAPSYVYGHGFARRNIPPASRCTGENI